MSVISNVKIKKTGLIVGLTNAEFVKYPSYKYYTSGKFSVQCDINGELCKIKIPSGFLTDGNSGGPDYGVSWLFHDYLYATHIIEDRNIVDDIMAAIIEVDIVPGWFASWYLWGFKIVTHMDAFGLFSKAWNESGVRGPEYYIGQTCG